MSSSSSLAMRQLLPDKGQHTSTLEGPGKVASVTLGRLRGSGREAAMAPDACARALTWPSLPSLLEFPTFWGTADEVGRAAGLWRGMGGAGPAMWASRLREAPPIPTEAWLMALSSLEWLFPSGARTSL